jgi:hypothetical protein
MVLVATIEADWLRTLAHKFSIAWWRWSFNVALAPLKLWYNDYRSGAPANIRFFRDDLNVLESDVIIEKCIIEECSDVFLRVLRRAPLVRAPNLFHLGCFDCVGEVHLNAIQAESMIRTIFEEIWLHEVGFLSLCANQAFN